mgnify:CR=1 FL=1
MVLEQAARVEDYPRLAARLDRSKFVTRLAQKRMTIAKEQIDFVKNVRVQQKSRSSQKSMVITVTPGEAEWTGRFRRALANL